MSPEPVRLGILTVSDGVAAGEREDFSGDGIDAWAAERGADVVARDVVADERAAIVRALARMVDDEGCDVVLTTGGTGVAARDVTPEATRVAVDRLVPGIAERIRARGTGSTPYADLGRGLAGIRGACLIVNLPGSPSGVEDGLAVLDAVVDHAVDLLRGETAHGPGSAAAPDSAAGAGGSGEPGRAPGAG